MGNISSILQFERSAKVDKLDVIEPEVRRRNSLAFSIAQFLRADDYQASLEEVRKEKLAKAGDKPLRVSKFGKIGDSIINGNLYELRNQVFVHFKHINRNYPDHHLGNTLLHMICQEGYSSMLNYLLNPANRNDVDNNRLDLMAKNQRDRIALFLCFTPPTATSCGLKYGIDEDGNILATKPEEIDKPGDWCKPGGPKSREQCVRMLLENGCDPNMKDFQDFTALHYAAMWGWITAVKLLIEYKADINIQTTSGRTALMFAVEYDNDSLVKWLCLQSESIKLNLDLVDVEGCSALIIAVDKGEGGRHMADCLLKAGADPNILTLRRKSALKIACTAQDLHMVNMLLDHEVLRRKSAFNLLNDDNYAKIALRLAEEEQKAEEQEKRKQREAELHLDNASKAHRGNKRVRDAWVEYRDKKSLKSFYYNTITRKSQFEKPKDFVPDRTKLVRDAIFGLNFYH